MRDFRIGIYIIPKNIIYNPGLKKGIKGLSIYKDLIYKGCGWYEQYRVIYKDEFKKINDIWQKILEEESAVK